MNRPLRQSRGSMTPSEAWSKRARQSGASVVIKDWPASCLGLALGLSQTELEIVNKSGLLSTWLSIGNAVIHTILKWDVNLVMPSLISGPPPNS